MNIETLKKQFEREQDKLLWKYANRFMKKGYLISWSQRYIKIKGWKK
jgi:hypothetical protein